MNLFSTLTVCGKVTNMGEVQHSAVGTAYRKLNLLVRESKGQKGGGKADFSKYLQITIFGEEAKDAARLFPTDSYVFLNSEVYTDVYEAANGKKYPNTKLNWVKIAPVVGDKEKEQTAPAQTQTQTPDDIPF